MASKPGILTEWPWTWLGDLKYMVLAPWVIHSTYSYFTNNGDFSRFFIVGLLVWRAVHNLIWISYSRYRTAKGNNRILDKNIDFHQVDRERNWDDQIILNGLAFYVAWECLTGARNLPWWRTNGILLTVVLHAGPVEFLYYWLHRALHHHFLYSRYHSHHHSSIVTEPITSVIHPFGEHIAYFILFAIPMVSTVVSGTASLISIAGYITYIDLMNNMGHCNFELIPKRLFSTFPPLYYLFYTPSYHSLHHTQFRTNYSLFMPFYDYVYGTMDQSSDALYEASLVRKEEAVDVVHLTHLTTPNSIYHLRLGFAHLASHPHRSKWYLWFMWPLTICSTLLTWMYGRTFILERCTFRHLKLQTWVVPKYTFQYYMDWQRHSINATIENALLQADEKGIKVLSFGLLNMDDGLNGNGELFLRRHPKLKVKLVDGSSLVVAILLNTIPQGTTRILIRGNLTKVAYSISLALCQAGIQVSTTHEVQYNKLKSRLCNMDENNLFFSKHDIPKTWLVGDGLSEEEQLEASQGTTFIPFSEFPPKKVRKDCSYYTTPAMLAPKHLQNLDSCENWLPRRVMSAGRIAGILHTIEGWNVHECGNDMFDIQKIWKASLHHGFRPCNIS